MKNLTPSFSEREMLDQLAERGFPPFELRTISRDLKLPSGRRADAEVALTFDGRTHHFIVECKTLGTPRQIDTAVAQARAYVHQRPGTYPLVVVPYLSQDALDELIQAGVSGIDLSGNGVIVGPEGWFVERRGQPNPYPASASIRNVFRGKSSLVCRALLLREAFPSVNAIVETMRDRSILLEEHVTQATVSKVLQVLEDELLVDRGAGIRATHPAELLNRLVKNYRPPKESRAVHATTPAAGDQPPIAYVSAAADRLGVRYAVDMVTDYVPFPGMNAPRIYVQSLAPLLAGDVIRVQDRFATVHVIESQDPTVYFDARRAGTWRVAPIQAYLELASGSKRDREISETIRQAVLTPTVSSTSLAEPPADV